jgi:hypothetical protein
MGGIRVRVERLHGPAYRDEDYLKCSYTIVWPFESLHFEPFSSLLQLPATCRQLRTGAKNLPFTPRHFVVNLADLEVFSNALPHTVRSGIKLLHMPLLYMPMDLDTDECRHMLGNLGCFPALETIWVTWVFYADWRVRNPLATFAKGIRSTIGRDIVEKLAGYEELDKPLVVHNT